MPSSNSDNSTNVLWDLNMLERGSQILHQMGNKKLKIIGGAYKKTSLSDDEFQDLGEESNGIYEELLDGLPCDDTNKINKLREESLELCLVCTIQIMRLKIYWRLITLI